MSFALSSAAAASVARVSSKATLGADPCRPQQGDPPRPRHGGQGRVNQLKDGDKKGLVDSVETFIFDCDGVIWKGDSSSRASPRRSPCSAIWARGSSSSPTTPPSPAGLPQEVPRPGARDHRRGGLLLLLRRRRVPRVRQLPQGQEGVRRRQVGILEELDGVGIHPAAGGWRQEGDPLPGQLMEHDPDVAAVIVGFDRNVATTRSSTPRCASAKTRGACSSPPTRTR